MSQKRMKIFWINLFLHCYVKIKPTLKSRKSFSSEENFKSIAIYSTTALGDLMFNTPAIRAIRQRYPDAFITLVSSEKNKTLVEGSLFFDRIVYWDEKVKHVKKLVKQLKEQPPQLTVVLHSKAPYDILSAVMSGSQYIVKDIYGGKNIGMEKWLVNEGSFLSCHLIQRKLNMCSLLGCDVSNNEMVIPVDFPHLNKEAGKKIIGFQMGASEPIRCWPISKFSELAKLLFQLGPEYEVVLIGTKKELAYEKFFLNSLSEDEAKRVTSSIGKTDLKQLMGIIENMDLLVTGDTGPLHLAVALKTKTVSLFVTANPDHTGPYQDMELHQVMRVSTDIKNLAADIKIQPLAIINAEDVLERIELLLPR